MIGLPPKREIKSKQMVQLMRTIKLIKAWCLFWEHMKMSAYTKDRQKFGLEPNPP